MVVCASDRGRRGHVRDVDPWSRATTSLSEFGGDANRLRRIAIENPRIVAVSPVPNSNRAVVTLVAQTRLPRTGQLVDIDIRDQWVLEDGKLWLCGSCECRLNSCRNQMHDLTNVLCRWRLFSRRISILWALVEKFARLEGIKACGRDALRLAHFE